MTSKPRKLTKQQKAMAERIAERGGTLMVEGPAFVDHGGCSYHGRVVKNLVAAGVLKSNEDAMFGTRPQSYRLADA